MPLKCRLQKGRPIISASSCLTVCMTPRDDHCCYCDFVAYTCATKRIRKLHYGLSSNLIWSLPACVFSFDQISFRWNCIPPWRNWRHDTQILLGPDLCWRQWGTLMARELYHSTSYVANFGWFALCCVNDSVDHERKKSKQSDQNLVITESNL